MNGVELFLLGRTLMKIGEEAMPEPAGGADRYAGSTRSILIVLGDLSAHPDSAIGEIAKRTGLPQSQVSTAVARLKEAGSIETTPDPTDRRRMLVRRSPEPSSRVTEVRATTIDDALVRIVDPTDGEAIAEVKEALATLARHLPPTALARLRPRGDVSSS
ncbi:MarR family transcriptional regulator [Embleya sp. NBC_00896]|uniref:MarR family transcriptional regulator n=1 Tax=Embleya sp. NBC_00896 TaxID=2975961 RepID=UPI0038701A62|nr:MarR family transcriptional regulator [Embleya sp. NBC_00896]